MGTAYPPGHNVKFLSPFVGHIFQAIYKCQPWCFSHGTGRQERGRAEFSHIALLMCHCRKVTASLLTPLARCPRERVASYNPALSGSFCTWQGSPTSDDYFLQTKSSSDL